MVRNGPKNPNQLKKRIYVSIAAGGMTLSHDVRRFGVKKFFPKHGNLYLALTPLIE